MGLEEILKSKVEESVRNSLIRSAIRELQYQDVVIDFLYEALGPANDEILEMAYEEADRSIND